MFESIIWLVKIYTVGHSNRKLDDFLSLLAHFKIQQVVDVRTIPKSKYNPHFSQENIKECLEEVGIKYFYLKELGGLRHPSSNSINTGLKNEGFRGYADYMQTEEF